MKYWAHFRKCCFSTFPPTAVISGSWRQRSMCCAYRPLQFLENKIWTNFAYNRTIAWWRHWLQLPECFEASYCIQYFFFCEEALMRDTDLHYKDCSEVHSGSCSQLTSSFRGLNKRFGAFLITLPIEIQFWRCTGKIYLNQGVRPTFLTVIFLIACSHIWMQITSLTMDRFLNFLESGRLGFQTKHCTPSTYGMILSLTGTVFEV